MRLCVFSCSFLFLVAFAIAAVDASCCHARAVATRIACTRACGSQGQPELHGTPCSFICSHVCLKPMFVLLFACSLMHSLRLLSQSLPRAFMKEQGRPKRDRKRERERERERERRDGEREREKTQSRERLAAACITKAALSTKPCGAPARALSPPCNAPRPARTRGMDPHAKRPVVATAKMLGQRPGGPQCLLADSLVGPAVGGAAGGHHQGRPARGANLADRP